jgi:hypothetical protein
MTYLNIETSEKATFSSDEEEISTMDGIHGIRSVVMKEKRSHRFCTYIRDNMRAIKHTELAIFLFLCSLYFMCLGNSLADRLNLNNIIFVEDKRLVLPDPIMSLLSALFERLELQTPINDILEGMAIGMACVYVTLFPKYSRCDAFRRFFLVWACANCLRTLCIILTVLTNPYLECQSKPLSNLFSDAFAIFTAQRQSCGDVFFSGHSVGYTLSCLMWLTYRRRRFSGKYRNLITMLHVALTTLYVIFIVVCLVVLIATKFHYSVDVFIGSFLSIMIWQKVHWLLEVDVLRKTPLGRIINKIDGQYNTL